MFKKLFVVGLVAWCCGYGVLAIEPHVSVLQCSLPSHPQAEASINASLQEVGDLGYENGVALLDGVVDDGWDVGYGMDMYETYRDDQYFSVLVTEGGRGGGAPFSNQVGVVYGLSDGQILSLQAYMGLDDQEYWDTLINRTQAAIENNWGEVIPKAVLADYLRNQYISFYIGPVGGCMCPIAIVNLDLGNGPLMLKVEMVDIPMIFG